MKLFAVALLAGAAPAYADHATQATQVTAAAQPKLTAEQQALRAARLAYEAAQREPIVIHPRVLGNARPACGNTGGKVDKPENCTKAEVRAVEAYDEAYEVESRKREAKVKVAYGKLMSVTKAAYAADPTLEARLLADRRPACGNTMSKSAKPRDCVAIRGERDPVAALLNGDR
jgi:hypothetical protein